MTKHTTLSEHIDALQKASPNVNLFVIADPAQDAKLKTDYLNPSLFTQQRCLLNVADISTQALAVSPFLVLIPKTADERFWRAIETFVKNNVPTLTVLASPLPFDDLHAHLNHFTEVTLPDNSQMILAYWDPAILGTLLGNPQDSTLHVDGPVFTTKQHQALLSPIAAWWYWDRQGQLQTLRPQGNGPAQHDHKRIKLAHVQVDMLVEASVPDHILSHLRVNQPALLAPIAPQKQYEEIKRHLLGARQLHVSSMADILQYVAAGLLYGTRLQTDPSIVALLDQVRQRSIPLAQALEQFP